ncbi:glycosyltransferase [Paenibacillus sp. LPE1-1-1.1]|uniref:GAP1-N2 domain-containing protein n=1 Tax=Paenibacillus sp. LPE1-1-1.1 TaxID=3135230 RepID=UPI003436CEFD
MRDFTPRRMIQQQMYARERRGIFRSTEGYDTVARSSGLDPAFIKKILHPFCVYDAPTELTARGEKNEALYPETMHLLHLENGDVVLGRSVYQAADFTGLRSAFFTHNYIIPAGYGSESANEYKSWLHAAFADGYDIENGTELPELAVLPVQTGSAVKPSNRSLLALLNIGEKPFKQLLYAMMSAISGKKKIYVALDVPVAQLPDKAKQLLTVLYASLPNAYRKQLGFITYAKEPQSRKSVHLTFVEQGSLRQGDRSIEKDYTFDFASGRLMNVELDGTDQPFLDFAWDNLDQPERTDRFFHFAGQMLAGMEPERQTAADSYHQLCVMYRIEEGDETLYETHKTAVLRGLLEYLQPTGALHSKNRLNDLFLSRFDYEFDRVRQGIVPNAFIVDVFKDYYLIENSNIESKLVTYFIHALNHAVKQNEQETIDSVYAAIEGNPALGKAFFAKLMADSRLTGSLLIPFLEKKLEEAAGVKSMLELIAHWGSVQTRLFDYEPFHDLARRQLLSKLERERYSIPGVSKALSQLRRLEEEAGLQIRKQPAYDYEDLYGELELAAYRAMLAELQMDKLTKEQLGQADFLSFKDRLQRWNGQLQDPHLKSAAFELLALYESLMLPEPASALFSRLSAAEIDHVQQAVRQILAGRLELADAPRIVLAFLHSSDLDSVDYEGLLSYLQRNAPNKEIVYQFFQWSEKHPDFIRPKGFVPAYAVAIIAFFKNHDRDAFKKRANRKQFFDKAGPTLAAVYKQAERELSSPLAKFFRRNRKATLITTIAGLGIIFLVSGIMLSFSGKDASNDEGAALPEVSPTAQAVVNEPETLVYAEETAASEGQEAATSLVFLFKNAASCALFAPSSISIEPHGAEAAEYTELKLMPDCGTEASDASPTPDPEATAVTTEPSTPATVQPTETPLADPEAAPEPEGYASRVVVDLGKQADIPADSIIRIGDDEYKLTTLQVIDK